ALYVGPGTSWLWPVASSAYTRSRRGELSGRSPFALPNNVCWIKAAPTRRRFARALSCTAALGRRSPLATGRQYRMGSLTERFHGSGERLPSAARIVHGCPAAATAPTVSHAMGKRHH